MSKFAERGFGTNESRSRERVMSFACGFRPVAPHCPGLAHSIPSKMRWRLSAQAPRDWLRLHAVYQDQTDAAVQRDTPMHLTHVARRTRRTARAHPYTRSLVRPAS
jgi:hypothetical protein